MVVDYRNRNGHPAVAVMYDELCRQRIANRVCAKAPGYSQSVPALKHDRGLLEEAAVAFGTPGKAKGQGGEYSKGKGSEHAKNQDRWHGSGGSWSNKGKGYGDSGPRWSEKRSLPWQASH